MMTQKSSSRSRTAAVQNRRWPRIVLVVIAVLGASGAGSFEALFAPSADLWKRWETHDPRSTTVVDHSAWDRLLKTYVVSNPDGINRFAYGRVTEADRAALQAYVDELAATRISSYTRAEQLAYWINLYNALTNQVVLDHYPVESIRDIDTSPGLFGDGPWDAKVIDIEGEAVSLNDIEHRILRPIWRDPRIHYAVNCASVGCPNLQQTAYTAANTNALLNSGARAYVNHPRGVTVINRRLTVSSIYVWFEEDFGGSDAGVISHLRYHAEPELAAALANVTAISGHAYDWQLNDVSGPAL
jgi:hypothetical protein